MFTVVLIPHENLLTLRSLFKLKVSKSAWMDFIFFRLTSTVIINEFLCLKSYVIV